MEYSHWWWYSPMNLLVRYLTTRADLPEPGLPATVTRTLSSSRGLGSALITWITWWLSSWWSLPICGIITWSSGATSLTLSCVRNLTPCYHGVDKWTSFPNEFNDCLQLTESETLELGRCRGLPQLLPGIAGYYRAQPVLWRDLAKVSQTWRKNINNI